MHALCISALSQSEKCSSALEGGEVKMFNAPSIPYLSDRPVL